MMWNGREPKTQSKKHLRRSEGSGANALNHHRSLMKWTRETGHKLNDHAIKRICKKHYLPSDGRIASSTENMMTRTIASQ